MGNDAGFPSVKDPANWKSCVRCSGRGSYDVGQRGCIDIVTCPACNGRGKIVSKPAQQCDFVGDRSNSMLEVLNRCSLPKGHEGLHRYIPRRRGW